MVELNKPPELSMDQQRLDVDNPRRILDVFGKGGKGSLLRAIQTIDGLPPSTLEVIFKPRSK